MEKKDKSKPVAKKKKPGFYMAKGKSITSKKGIIGEGEEVRPEFFTTNGKEIIEKFLAAGIIEEKNGRTP